jgi:methyl-accepting chemotaxis protein
MMQKIIAWLFVVCSTWLLYSASAELVPRTSFGTAISVASEPEKPSLKQERTSEGIRASRSQEPIIHGTSDKGSQDQDFYKATVQAYKDFNEQTVKYFSLALAVLSVLVTIFVTWFFFMFRKTLADIKNDLSRDADRLRDVYSRTFDLLNEQAKTNFEIFKSRESELKTAIVEVQGLYEKIRSSMKEISDIQQMREPVAEKLAAEEVTKGEEKRNEIREEVEDYKKDLEELREEKG